jgi:uncharacterized protein (TIGR02246 family)
MKGRAVAAVFVLCGALTMGQAQAADVSAAGVEAWLERYGEAWVARDPDKAAALFTEDAIYHENPHESAFQGRQAIHDYWARVTEDQRDVTFSSEVITTFGRNAVAHWSAQFKSAASGATIHLDGVFLLAFADEMLVQKLQEWWIVKVDPAEQP